MAVSPRPATGSALIIKLAGSDATLTGVLDGTFSQTMETIDVTEMSDIRRKFVPAVTSGTISGNLYYDQNDVDFAKLEVALANGYQVGVSPAAYHEIQLTWSTGASYRAKAIFTEWTVSVSQQDVVRASFSAQIHDVVTVG